VATVGGDLHAAEGQESLRLSRLADLGEPVHGVHVGEDHAVEPRLPGPADHLQGRQGAPRRVPAVDVQVDEHGCREYHADPGRFNEAKSTAISTGWRYWRFDTRLRVRQRYRRSGSRAGRGCGVSEVRAMRFTGVKVFSATKAKEREELGESITRWLQANADLEIVDRVVSQSSDNEFHCLTIVLFYRKAA
jgi:hypothetical protein